jgi:drug/metabolite transporter (DMT)-like permease
MTTQTQYRLGLVLVTASALAWSSAGYFTRLVPLDNWTLLFWRGVFAAVGMLVFIRLLQGKAGLRAFGALGVPGWIYAIISGLGMIFFITSLTLTTVAHVSIIYGTVPFVAAAVSGIVLRERPSPMAFGCSLVALLGVVVTVGFGLDGGSLSGDLLAFGMTLVMAGMMVVARRYRDIPILPAACLSAILSALVSLPLAGTLLPGGGDLFNLTLFGLVNSAIGLALFTLGARLIPAVETGLIGSLEVPLAPVWVWLAFGETPDRNTILGGLLVFVAVLTHLTLGTRSRALGKAA